MGKHDDDNEYFTIDDIIRYYKDLYDVQGNEDLIVVKTRLQSILRKQVEAIEFE